MAALFRDAVLADDDEMAAARARRERSNAPGYARDPLGDQITWEQLLSHCKKTGVGRLWIASDDSDHVTKFYGRVFLNPFLHEELIQYCSDGLEFDASTT